MPSGETELQTAILWHHFFWRGPDEKNPKNPRGNFEPPKIFKKNACQKAEFIGIKYFYHFYHISFN